MSRFHPFIPSNPGQCAATELKSDFLAVKAGRLRGGIFVLWLNGLLAAISISSPVIAGDIEIEETRSLIGAVIEKWSNLSSVSMETSHSERWVPEYLDYRESIGYPMKINYPTNEGITSYFAKGEKFRYDRNYNWGNGELMLNEAGAWNGRFWQDLNRYPVSGPHLSISKVRKRIYEQAAHRWTPFYFAFPFLVPKAKGDKGTDEWRVSPPLAVVSDPKAWRSAISRANRTVKSEVLDGRSVLIFEFTIPYSFGSEPSKPLVYKVWIDKKFPSFPVKVETFGGKGEIYHRFEVKSFHRIDGFSVPEVFHYTDFDINTDFGNRPYLHTKVRVAKVKVNEMIPDQQFELYSWDVRSITDLVTGKRTFIKKGTANPWPSEK